MEDQGKGATSTSSPQDRSLMGNYGKCQKDVQNWQLCVICQLSKNQTIGLDYG